MKKTICVIGGGAAGLMAAYAAASQNENAEIVLLERNQKTARKILVTGKGRCNVTNAGDTCDYMASIPRNPRFLYSALNAFTNADLMDLMRENGVETKIERGKRVFPVSDKAMDIADFLSRIADKPNVTRLCGVRVLSVAQTDSGFSVSHSGGGTIACDAVIIATGGLSYPKTGSDGDGYKIAKSLGHSVTKLFPSLVALKTRESFVTELAGLTLKNIAVKFLNQDGKRVFEDFGELLFTHEGVSGPVVLSASAVIAERLAKESFKLIIDLKPALDEKKLDIRLLNDFNKGINKSFINALDELLPKSLIPVIVELSGVSPQKKVNEITKQERRRIVSAMKSLTLEITGTDGFDHAVITRGGVSVSEINPKTMESKLIKNLFFAGEVLDADALTGGFNLQIAFSTGYLAGKSASRNEV